MTDRLEDLLRSCTVRVTGGPMPGAGFFIAPGKVITCAHVVGESPTLTVLWERDGREPAEFPVAGLPMVLPGRGRPIPALDGDYPDIAILDLSAGEHPCVRVDLDWPGDGDGFQVFGYPQEGGAVRLTPARLTYRGTHGHVPAAYLDLASDTIKPGMSGAPVLNLRTGAVCGIIAASKHTARPDGALAVPFQALTADLAEILTANRVFHTRDLGWDTTTARRDLPAPTTDAGRPRADAGAERTPVRVFISYAHDDPGHEDRVRALWLFLRANGIDARLDLAAAEQRTDWAQWMTREIRDADRILVIASPEYRRRAEGDAGPGEGRGVQWEARLLREVFYAEQGTGLQRILPVVLPGGTAAGIPLWLAPASATHYQISDYTISGADKLLRVLTGQPWETVPPVGAVPVLRPRGSSRPPQAPAQTPLRTQVIIKAALSDAGTLESTVHAAGSLLCQRQGHLPAEVTAVWNALRLPPSAAGQRMAEAGRNLAAALLDPASQQVVAQVLNRLRPGQTAEMVLAADGAALSLPVELIRLATGTGSETGPLGLFPAVSIIRCPVLPGDVRADGDAPAAAAGPLKILAAVAAPDETKTPNPPLDTEAEMAAVLDAVTGVASASRGQVRILEVASLAAIRQALASDSYHVLHLSAHGSPQIVELEDEDGNPVPVTPEALMQTLRHAGRPVPLIVLSSCSGGATGSTAMAAELITQGADRVIAMLAPVTDTYATTLASHLYHELSAHPSLAAGQALAQARYLSEESQSRTDPDHPTAPQYGVATLLAANSDGALINPQAPPRPLPVATTQPGGKLARDLPMGSLIGRRAQLRTAMSILRRTPGAVQRHGAASGVQLTGIGGIGKTAVAGRIISRLRGDGWLIAIHEGRWNPTALITATAQAISDTLGNDISHPARTVALPGFLDRLTDSASDDGPKLAAVAQMLARHRLLIVFDDFEQNLTPGGDAFLDPAIDEAITTLADAADPGALLLTTRYRLPGPDRFLARVPLPPLSHAELRRLFLRLPALQELDNEDKRLLIRTIGGHPRLIELTDALLRGGHANLRHVQVKLRQLARDQQLDLTPDPSPAQAINQAMILGSADILLSQLLTVLTPSQTDILRQLAVCRASMSLDDLAFILTPVADHAGPASGTELHAAALRRDVDRLTDLTFVMPGEDIVMHPWTAELVGKIIGADLTAQHEGALAMRLRLFEQGRGGYDDLIDIPRHLAALGRYGDVASVANQATRILPGTLATVAYLAEIRPQIPETERAWTIVADLEVQAVLRAGDLPAAIRQLQAIHQQAQARAAADPANTEWQRDLSVSHNNLGNAAVAAGDLSTAGTHYQASLDIRQRLAAADPANTEWQRDLSVSHNKVGDVARSAGDLATAHTHYQASLDIRQRLAAADPANTQWQRDLSVSHDNLGDAAIAAGDLSTAHTHYQASLDIAQQLAAADPANTQWQRDLSISHNNLGDAAIAAGDLSTAHTHYQASLDIAQQLAAADPTNTQWQRDLQIVRQKFQGLSDV